MYNGPRVYRLGHERDMVSPLARGISFPRKRDMASPQRKEPVKKRKYGYIHNTCAS